MGFLLLIIRFNQKLADGISDQLIAILIGVHMIDEEIRMIVFIEIQGPIQIQSRQVMVLAFLNNGIDKINQIIPICVWLSRAI